MTSKHTTKAASAGGSKRATKIVPALPLHPQKPTNATRNRQTLATPTTPTPAPAPVASTKAATPATAGSKKPKKSASNGVHTASPQTAPKATSVPGEKPPSTAPTTVQKSPQAPLVSQAPADDVPHAAEPTTMGHPHRPQNVGESRDHGFSHPVEPVNTNGTPTTKNQFNGSSASFVPQHVVPEPAMVNQHNNYSQPPRPRGQNHHASGSIQYAYNSNGSSPAPAATTFPPPGFHGHNNMPMHDYHNGVGANGHWQQQQHSGYNEYPPVDNYARQMANYPQEVYGAPNGYSYGAPSTPQSFHDSHSSGHGEENSMQMYPPHGHPYSMPPDDGVRRHQQHMSTDMSHMMHQPQMMLNQFPMGQYYHQPHGSHSGGIISHGPPDFGADIMPLTDHIKNHFNDPSVADCRLEIRYNARAPPILIYAHRLIVSQSAPLRHAINAAPALPPPGQSLIPVIMDVDGRFVDPNAFIVAIQYLYGFGLFAIPDPPALSEGVSMVGNAMDRFKFCIGYAVAGRALELPNVAIRGAQIACQCLSWDTIETALEFCLGDIPHRGTLHDQAQLEPASKVLIRGIIDFLINNFPVDFELDTSVTDPMSYRRMPMTVPPGMELKTIKAAPTPPVAPVSMENSCVSFGKHAKSEKLRLSVSNIKFGDLNSPQDAHSHNGHAAGGHSNVERPAFFQVLSRVLLNLPLEILKEALENNLQDGVPGWCNNTARSIVAKMIIDEREKRRLALLGALQAGQASPDAAAVLPRLQRYDPQIGDRWDVLCWKESLEEGSSKVILMKKWVPIEVPKTEGVPNGKNSGFGLYP